MAAGARPSVATSLGSARFVLVLAGAAAAAVGIAFVVAMKVKTQPSPASPPSVAPPTEAPSNVKTGFEDRAKEAGIDFKMEFLPNEQGEHFKINLYDHGAGVAVADYDGDGRDDIYFCNQLGPNALYHNEGGGRFTNVTKRAGVAMEGVISVAATFADVDGDGRQDLYVTTTRAGNVLFHNRGDGTFEDATAKAGLTLVAHSETPTFFDADGDGHPDLLVTNTAKWTTENFDKRSNYWQGIVDFFDLIASEKEKNRFYRNKGDGTFEDWTAESGLAGVGWGGDTAVFDYDGDGDLDVLIGNMFGWSRLYANDGKGHFKDVTREALGKTSWGTVGTKAFDYDGDGRLDLFLADMHSDMWMTPDTPVAQMQQHKKYGANYGPLVDQGIMTRASGLRMMTALDVRLDQVVFGSTLFRNLGGGRFEETSDKAGVETLWPWAIAAADFDGDGFMDVYLPSGMGYPYEYLHSPLLMNNGNGTFTDKSAEAGIDPPRGGTFLEHDIGGKKASRSSRSAAVADFDGDGRPDIVVNNFNDVPYLLMNRFPKKSHVAFRLTGAASGRDAVGALVTLRVGAKTLVRQVESASGYLAQSSKTLLFGLGDAVKIDSCVVRWPSGRVQDLGAVEINTTHDVTEPAK